MTLIHGTFNAYTNGKCRCQPCTVANRTHQQNRRYQKQEYARYGTRYIFTPEEREARRSCLICQTPLLTHPLVACWRAV